MESSPREIAVIGCGALGLTSATLAQNAGANITIYAKDIIPDTRSSRATGIWSPDSRIALADKVAPEFPVLWEEMARTSFHTYRRYLGLPGTPVEWMDLYACFNENAAPADVAAAAQTPRVADPLHFASYNDRIRDLTPHSEAIPSEVAPFKVDRVRRGETMVFNIADYGHTLMSDFLLRGGKIVHAEFHAPSDIARLKERVVINCTGYGARALWKDESLIPVRGQIGWLVPQPEVNYALYYRQVSVIPRRDGIVVQDLAGGDMRGVGNDSELPDRAESEAAVEKIAELMTRLR